MPLKLPRNFVLIGMPGCGKSTVGRVLAGRLGWALVDLDLEIERVAGMRLREINAREGFTGLSRRESAAATTLACDEAVIAPGGSVVYSEPAMRHLRGLGRIVYLHVAADLLVERAGDLTDRGVMIRPGMSYADLIDERDPLYRRWADRVIDCAALEPKAVAEVILQNEETASAHSRTRTCTPEGTAT